VKLEAIKANEQNTGDHNERQDVEVIAAVGPP